MLIYVYNLDTTQTGTNYPLVWRKIKKDHKQYFISFGTLKLRNSYQVCAALSKATIGGFGGRGRHKTSCKKIIKKSNK